MKYIIWAVVRGRRMRAVLMPFHFAKSIEMKASPTNEPPNPYLAEKGTR